MSSRHTDREQGDVPADHWFWQSGDRWVAVVADHHDDWWEGADPADIAARPDPWRIPITERPTSGTLVYPRFDRPTQKTDVDRIVEGR